MISQPPPAASAAGRRRAAVLAALLLAALAAAIAAVPAGSARAQSLPLSLGQSAVQAPPTGVERRGLTETTAIHLDGKPLFRIASPAVLDRSNPGNQIPVEVRAAQIEENLQTLLAPARGTGGGPFSAGDTVLDPASAEVRIEKLNGQPVLLVTDATLSSPRLLLTVTDTDAQAQGVPADQLAQTWQVSLQDAIRTGLAARQPEAVKARTLNVAGLLLAALLANSGLAYLYKRFGDSKKRLQQEIKDATGRAAKQAADAAASAASAEDDSSRSATVVVQDTAAGPAPPEAAAAEGAPPAPEPVPPPHRRHGFRAMLHERLTVQQKLQAVQFIRWLLFWLMVAIAIGAVAASLYSFPQFRRAGLTLASTPILILAAWFVTGLITNLVGFVIDRFAQGWERSAAGVGHERRSLRVPTIVSAAKGLVNGVVTVIAIVWVLQRLRITPSLTLGAFAAVAALAVSFAAQSLIKDFVNGFLILLEDQFAIGDDVTIGSASGIVEYVNLRITQLRADDGRLITIPNSSITQVENKTRLWSRVDYRVDVSYDTDPDRALAAVRTVAREMAADPKWGPQILIPAEVLGVTQVSHAGMTIRLLVRTVPGAQGLVGLELRRRVKIAFDREGIRPGVPRTVVGQAAVPPLPPLEEGLPPAGHDEAALTPPRSQAGAGA